MHINGIAPGDCNLTHDTPISRHIRVKESREAKRTPIRRLNVNVRCFHLNTVATNWYVMVMIAMHKHDPMMTMKANTAWRAIVSSIIDSPFMQRDAFGGASSHLG
jgi:hypothetical protein